MIVHADVEDDDVDVCIGFVLVCIAKSEQEVNQRPLALRERKAELHSPSHGIPFLLNRVARVA